MIFLPKTQATIQQAKDIIAEYSRPLTVRQIYYRFVGKGLIPNSLRSYKRIATILADARKEGEIDYSDIVDNLRKPIQYQNWTSLSSYVDSIGYSYSRNLMQDQERTLEVWCEKDALSGLIEPITRKYDLTLQIVRGYSSLSALYSAAGRLSSAKILYLGDFDSSGLDIERDIEAKLNDDFGAFVEVERVALTREDIEEYKLPPAFAKLKDTRSPGFVAEHGNIAVELDALPPNVLVSKVEQAIKDNIDIDKFQKQKQIESREQDRLADLLSNLEEVYDEEAE